MIDFPNAKINLGLNITEKREDGFHEIESVFYPVNWRDVLEINPRKDDQIKFNVEGIEPFQPFGKNDLVTDEEYKKSLDFVLEDKQKNLCEKAYELMQEKYAIPGADIHLKKHIPIGAGLGGGSSDAAFTLKMVNSLFDLGLSHQELEKNAETLGSDCPFFIQNRPMFITGRGEKMEPIDLKMNGLHVVLIYPSIHISTKWAYSNIEPKTPEMDLQTIIRQDFSQWKKYLKNDFQPVVIKQSPYITDLTEMLYEHGALYSAMSGSGSTVYGIFSEFPEGIPFSAKDTHVILPI